MSRFSYRRKDDSGILEVVIVVVTLVILSAVSIPRMSQGAGTADDSTVEGKLAALRNAIDLYAVEHGGVFPTAARIEAQLTQYTDMAGNVSTTKTIAHVYGPYLDRIPALPVGIRRGAARIATSDAEGVGWLYTEATGRISANTTTQTTPGWRL